MKKSLLALCALFVFAGCSATEEKSITISADNAYTNFSIMESYFESGYTTYQNIVVTTNAGLIYTNYTRVYMYDNANFAIAHVDISSEETEMWYQKGTKQELVVEEVEEGTATVTADFKDWTLYDVTVKETSTSTIYRSATPKYYFVNVSGSTLSVADSPEYDTTDHKVTVTKDGDDYAVTKYVKQ